MRCVPAHHFTVAKARTWRSAIAEDPPYQRGGEVWSLDKQQLFIDSLLNGYDTPKIYLHDLRGRHPTRVYAIVDGKQRLTATWSYLEDRFPLAVDFRPEPGSFPDMPRAAVAPVGGLRFSQLDSTWQQLLLGSYLSVVLIRDASEEDIEDLFARLNNGEALNAPERRNALGGDMARLIREVARQPFFAEWLPFSNARHQHFELAARLLALDAARRVDDQGLPDLGPVALDAFVREHRQMAAADRAALIDGLAVQLNFATRVFSPADPLLASTGGAMLHCLFVRSILGSEGSGADPSRLRAFLGTLRRSQPTAPDGSEDDANEPLSLEERLRILHAAYDRFVQAGLSVGSDGRRARPRGPTAAQG
jgi:uncharacterized protein DUF262